MNENSLNRYELYKKTGWKYTKIDLFIKHGYLNLSEDHRISLESINSLVTYLEKISSEYVSFRKFLVEVLGINEKTDIKPIKKKLNHIIDFIELPFCINHYRSFVSIASIKSYSDLIQNSGDYILFDEASQIHEFINNNYRNMSLYQEINSYPYKGVYYLSKKEVEALYNRINIKNEEIHKWEKFRITQDKVIANLKNEQITIETIDSERNNQKREGTNSIIEQEFKCDITYIDIAGIQELFSASADQVRVASKEGVFGEPIFSGSRKLYLFSIVRQAYESAKIIERDYCSTNEAKKLLGCKHLQQTLTSKIRRIQVPCESWLYGKTKFLTSVIYLRSDLDDYVFKRSAPSDPHDYFFYFYKKIKIESHTKELFQKFCEITISQSNASKNSIIHAINCLLSVAKNMERIKKEVYSYGNDEIRSFMESITVRTHKYKFYLFLKFLSQQRMCKFEMSKIKNPQPKKKSHDLANEDDIFTFEELKSIYEYTNDINHHVNSSVDSYLYSSTWLFVLLHLSNAWRSGDIVNTPKVFPEDIGIKDIRYFQIGKAITLAQGQLIINQLRNYELRISKTNIKRSFYCNIDLVIPIATAMCINEFHRRESEFYTERLMNFLTENNQPSPWNIKLFFSSSDKFENLKFGNRKMNKSILTHLYYSIQRNYGDGNSAFMIVAKLRGHVSDITKEYINKTSEFGEITKALFNRGEFGFLYNELMNVISEEKKSFFDQTLEIQKVRSVLSPKLIEIIIGYIQTVENDKFSIVSPMEREINFQELNDLENERLEVIEKVKQLTPSEAFELVRKIYLRELPSKEKHIQCLTYPGCFRESNQFDCKSCKYSIPNYMAISALFDEFIIKVNSFKAAKTTGTRKREEKFLKNLMTSIGYAIDTFGEDFVWSFYEGGERGFEEKLKSI
ncbi:hypothetical protein [Paenibacillus endoradicis]|uniref:hypothetical protein n=1 Tax=Paenibacillus endoradicis TaxID=2972487 RepID=UPI0021595B54|nr:hypothetical protein [Paenibacillus endoradicis]MCR8659170.1 hypothetical protein [Paenibacillus endoradicis]